MGTDDPTKHRLGYGRRDHATGMLHGHIRWPHNTVPTPFGCRWCGAERGAHGRQYMPGRDAHNWTQPTQRQVLIRMAVRRKQRLAAAVAEEARPFRYHAVGFWTASPDGESGDELICADCRTHCWRFNRILAHIDRILEQRLRAAGFVPTSPWGSDPLGLGR